MVRKSLLTSGESASDHFFNIALSSNSARLRLPFELYAQDGADYLRRFEAGQSIDRSALSCQTKYCAREKHRLAWAACLVNACEQSPVDLHTLIGCGQVVMETWVRHLYYPSCRKLASRWLLRLLSQRSELCFLDAYSNSEPIFNEQRHLRLTYLAARILRSLPLAETTQLELMLGCYCLDLGTQGLSLQGGEARRATIAILSFERPISRVVYDAVLNAPIEGEAPSQVGPSRAWIVQLMEALVYFDEHLQNWLVDNPTPVGTKPCQEAIWRSFRDCHHHQLTPTMIHALETEILNVN